MREIEYFCPILSKCPHWLDRCKANGCQHPDAKAIRREMSPLDVLIENGHPDADQYLRPNANKR